MFLFQMYDKSLLSVEFEVTCVALKPYSMYPPAMLAQGTSTFVVHIALVTVMCVIRSLHFTRISIFNTEWFIKIRLLGRGKYVV